MATMAQDRTTPYRDENREYRWHGHAGRGRLRDESANSSERQYAMLNHLAGLLSLLDFMLLGPLVTLIMWFVRRDDSEFLDDHGKEAVNFQLSLLIYTIGIIVAGIIFSIVTLGIGVIFAMIFGGLAFFGLWMLRLVGSILASIAAYRGDFYRYPMCLRLIR